MNKLKTISPIDGSVYVERDFASQSTIDDAIAKAHRAQSIWADTSIEARQSFCSNMVDAFVENEDEIAEQLTWQMGRPARYAAGEVKGFADRARTMIDMAPEALSDIVLSEEPGFERYIKRQALGVVFVIAPWNYPYLTAVNAIVPAILAGNTVILKHSAQTPLCAEQINAAFKKAHLPEGVFQILHLDHAQTEALIAHPDVNHIAFTGSVDGGIMVEQAAAGQFKSMGLELGGKDPAYVRADADLDHAVETVIDGAFFNSGQSCCGIERAYVHEALYDQFVDKAVELVKQYVLGRSNDAETTLGPMVKTAAADFVREQIHDACLQGAEALIDEELFEASEEGTPYLAPQLLVNVDHSMRVMTEESFGPVLGIQKVSSDDEAIGLMNDSEFGLTAAVFTQDQDAGVRIGEQLETGTFFINRCDYLDPELAWTGVKKSGKGCTLSRVGFESLTRPKSFHLKKL